jgi:hypothetical protein
MHLKRIKIKSQSSLNLWSPYTAAKLEKLFSTPVGAFKNNVEENVQKFGPRALSCKRQAANKFQLIKHYGRSN